VDGIQYLIIPDDAEAMLQCAPEKIDLMMGVKAENALAVQKTNPEIVLLMNPRPQALTLQPANNKPPFNDIRVRKAMQLAIDLPAIARDYYHGTVDPYPSW